MTARRNNPNLKRREKKNDQQHTYTYTQLCNACLGTSIDIQSDTSVWICNELLVWSFLFGLTVDIFCNTPGLNAAAATAMGFIRNIILAIFTHKGLPDDFVPGARSLKWGGYIVYSLACIGIFYTVLFILELFTISYASELFLSVTSSTLLTMLFVTVIECFSRTR